MKPRVQRDVDDAQNSGGSVPACGNQHPRESTVSRRVLRRRRAKKEASISATFTPQRRPPGSLGKQRFGASACRQVQQLRPLCMGDTNFSRSTRDRVELERSVNTPRCAVSPGGTPAHFRDWTPKSTIVPCPSSEPNRTLQSPDLPNLTRRGR